MINIMIKQTNKNFYLMIMTLYLSLLYEKSFII